MSRFDKLYRKCLLPKIFVKGWGNPSLINKIIESHKLVSKRETCSQLSQPFEVKMTQQSVGSNSTLIEGSFKSPFNKLVPESMEGNNEVAKFMLIIPKKWPTKYRPLCIHYAATGDHSFSRRKALLGNHLIKDGIASLIHINPFYGTRKPKDQSGSALNYLSDLFIMGGALILEAQVLLQWAKQQGFGPLAIHGISLGGHMASLGASVYPEPVCLVPCLSWTTASHAFTEGPLSNSVSWDVLSEQYNNDSVYSRSIRGAIEPPIPHRLLHCDNKIPNADSLKTVPNIPHKTDTTGTKPHRPIDTGSRNIHLLSNNLSNQSTYRTFSSGDANNSNESGGISSGKSRLSYIQRLRPLDILSVVRSLNEKVMKKEETERIIVRDASQVTFSQIEKRRVVDRDTVCFMRDLLDYFTHLGNYSVPVDTRLVTIVVAEIDAYIPIDGVAHFSDVWGPNCEVDLLKGVGHIEAYLRNSVWPDDKFREAIVRTLNRYVELYHGEPGPFGEKIIARAV